MPGYGANLVQSGARNLATQPGSRAAGVHFAAQRVRQAPATGSLSKGDRESPLPASTRPPQAVSPSSLRPPTTRTGQSSVTASMQHTNQKAQMEASSSALPTTLGSSGQGLGQNDDDAAASPRADALPHGPSSLLPGWETTDSPRPLVEQTQYEAQSQDASSGRQRIAPATAPSAAFPRKPRIEFSYSETALTTSDSASHVAYQGRRIRLEGASSLPSPATASPLQQRRASLPIVPMPDESGAVRNAAGMHPEQESGDFAARTSDHADKKSNPLRPPMVFSRPRARPLVVAHENTFAPLTADRNADQPEGPQLSTGSQAGGSRLPMVPLRATPAPLPAHESVLAPQTTNRTAHRAEKQHEGPRLSIGRLEIQIIQEGQENPAAQNVAPRGFADELDHLERSYVRQIG